MGGLIGWTRKGALRPPAAARPQTAFRMIQVGHLHVGLWMHSERDPSAEEWTASCRAFRKLRESCGESTGTLRSLIVSDGGGPNSQQRAQFFREAQITQYPTAVITNALDNPIKRGIATAISWTNPRFRAFDPERWWQAFQHVGLADKIARVWSELAELQAQLPPNQTFQLIASAQSAESLRRTSSRARPAGA
ncbi:MAG: hypothetical protein RL033_7992 [Pseudomonadota bacterium]